MMAPSVQAGGAAFFVCLGTGLSATDLSAASSPVSLVAAQGERKAQGEAFEQQSYLEDEALA
jgi:hypothetical protein